MQATQKKSFGVGPLILIGLGVIFLLYQLGGFGWGGWEFLWQFWPIILIALGADILLGRRYRGAIAITALIASGLLWFGGGIPVRAQQAQSHAISQELAGATRAEVHLKVGVSQLRIGALTESGRLVEGTIETRRGERLEQDFRMDGEAAVLNLESEQDNMGLPFFRSSGERTWDLRLNPNLPIALNIDTGVGQVDLDLTALNLTSLALDTGVGETNVSLPQSGQFKADVNTGIGAVTIHIPEGVAARVRASKGIGSLEVRGEFERQGDLYVSSDYDSAESRVELSVSGGIGSVLVTSSP